mmetsp:Transcript_63474/g.175966  ORF Transcript_63474/g.175966 Transcript_63474/m.175966 type:complete len:380 (+) Transcript_63474:587-1726(+)
MGLPGSSGCMSFTVPQTGATMSIVPLPCVSSTSLIPCSLRAAIAAAEGKVTCAMGSPAFTFWPSLTYHWSKIASAGALTECLRNPPDSTAGNLPTTSTSWSVMTSLTLQPATRCSCRRVTFPYLLETMLWMRPSESCTVATTSPFLTTSPTCTWKALKVVPFGAFSASSPAPTSSGSILPTTSRLLSSVTASILSPSWTASWRASTTPLLAAVTVCTTPSAFFTSKSGSPSDTMSPFSLRQPTKVVPGRAAMADAPSGTSRGGSFSTVVLSLPTVIMLWSGMASSMRMPFCRPSWRVSTVPSKILSTFWTAPSEFSTSATGEFTPTGSPTFTRYLRKVLPGGALVAIWPLPTSSLSSLPTVAKLPSSTLSQLSPGLSES